MIQSVNGDWLRERCAALLSQPAGCQSEPDAQGATPAAVLIPIIERPTGLTILLTQRTAHLRDHAGQISFPGGRCEPGDASSVMTALREAQEEVGISPSQVEVLASLPEYRTSTGFRVVPVVGLVSLPLNLSLDDFEVADVFEAPLTFFLEPGHYRREMRDHAGQSRSFWAVPWGDRFIWGATAGMLVCLRESLLETG